MKITYLLLIFLLSVTLTQSIPVDANKVNLSEYLDCKDATRCGGK